MKNTIETRKACNQREPATKNTTELRENFLTAKIFVKDEIQSNPAKFYFNSAAVHHKSSTVKVSKKEAEIVTLGSLENSNHCAINKLLVASVIETCQLQMGMTELKQGSVWNLMPIIMNLERKCIFILKYLRDNLFAISWVSCRSQGSFGSRINKPLCLH